jgi:hypothetical protein
MGMAVYEMEVAGYCIFCTARRQIFLATDVGEEWSRANKNSCETHLFPNAAKYPAERAKSALFFSFFSTYNIRK